MRKQYVTAQDLSNVLDISISNAYVRVRELNRELEKKGYQTIPGRIPIAYAKEKFYGLELEFEEVENGG